MTDQSQRKLNETVLNLLVLLATLALIFLTGEFSIRLYQTASQGRSFSHVKRSRTIANPELNYRLNPAYTSRHVNHTPGGFRGTEPYPEKLGENSAIMVGGSTVYGWGTTDTQTIPHILSSRLNSPVINAGIMGHHSYHVRLRLDELIQYDPEYLIFYVGHNDATAYVKQKDKWAPQTNIVGGVAVQPGRTSRWLYKTLKTIKSYSSFVDLVAEKLLNIYFRLIQTPDAKSSKSSQTTRRAEQVEVNPAVIEAFNENLSVMTKKLLEENITPVYVKQIYYLNPESPREDWKKSSKLNKEFVENHSRRALVLANYVRETNQRLEQLKSRFGKSVKLVDLPAFFYKKVPLASREKFFRDSIHPKPRGNRFIAKEIAEALKSQKPVKN